MANEERTENPSFGLSPNVFAALIRKAAERDILVNGLFASAKLEYADNANLRFDDTFIRTFLKSVDHYEYVGRVRLLNREAGHDVEEE